MRWFRRPPVVVPWSDDWTPSVWSLDVSLLSLGATYTVPDDRYVHLTSIQASITTDANAANRYLTTTISRHGTIIAVIPSWQAQAASTTMRACYAPALYYLAGLTTAEGASLRPLPPHLYLRPSDLIQFSATNAQAADTINYLTLTTRDWVIY
jgi:hypothetical protein